MKSEELENENENYKRNVHELQGILTKSDDKFLKLELKLTIMSIQIQIRLNDLEIKMNKMGGDFAD